ncbi:MAG: ABC transporter ATP-binding protein [Chloroflexi bacterium]|nr:ABC transporter ATP-binding protein [Chloroflexota bacterium]
MADGATKRFGDRVAVDSLSLTVRQGTILGVIGPSGAGKTTTIRMMTGALEPTSGTVRVLGEDPRRFRRATRERIGYMPQLFMLYPDLTAKENVDFVASLFGMLFRRRYRRVREVLELVDLWAARSKRASDLSGGMQRRLELACALVHEPTMLFLDEPTAGIDPLLRVRVWDELRRLRDAGRTLLVTTQYVNEAELCDDVALIANGRLVAYASPEELRRDAIGGDVVDVETTRAFDGSELSGLPFVREVRQSGPRSFRVIVEDAGTATPEVVDAINGLGGDVAAAREHRPTFDEVFAALVERDRALHGDPDAIDGDQDEGESRARTEAAQRESARREVVDRERTAAADRVVAREATQDGDGARDPSSAEPDR